MNVILSRLLPALAVAWLCGCTTAVHNYQPVAIPPITTPAGSTMTNPIHLHAIEFDDHGEPLNRFQLEGALMDVRDVKGKGMRLTLVLYAHGWNNNAREDNDNYQSFRDFLQDLNAVSVTGKPKQDHQLVGVYLSWRGKALDHPDALVRGVGTLISPFTFWNRINAVERVARFSCTEAVLSLSAEARRSVSPSATNSPGKFPDSRIVLVGHSMGGMLLERAVAQAYLGGMLLGTVSQEEAENTRQKRTKQLGDTTTNLTNVTNKLARLIQQQKTDAPGAQPGADSGDLAISATVFKGKHDALTAQAKRVSAALPKVSQDVRKLAGPDSRLLRDLTRLRERLSLAAPGQALAALRSTTPNPGPTPPAALALKQSERVTGLWRSVLAELAAQVEATEPPKPLADEARRLTREVLLALNEADKNAEELAGQLDAQTTATKLLAASAEDLVRAVNGQLDRGDLEREKARLESEANQIRMAIDQVGSSVAQYPADLIILVNPASEGIYAKQIQDGFNANSLLQKYNQSDGKRPFIIAISSRRDWATRFAFPLGNGINALTMTFRDYEETQGLQPAKKEETKAQKQAKEEEEKKTRKQFGYYWRTAPHLAEMVTHTIVPTGRPAGKTAESHARDSVKGTALLQENLKGIPDSQPDREKIKTTKGIVELIKEPKAQLTPYWVVDDRADIITKHGDIFANQDLRAVIANLYGIVQRHGLR